MICKKCGCELKPQAKFCPKCGETVEKIKHCSNCGNMMETGMKFCSSCGTSAVEAVEAVEEELIFRKEDAAEETKKQVMPEIVDANHSEDFVDRKQKEQTRTLEIFKSELKELSNEDNESKAFVLLFGTGVLYKHLYPLLQEDERLLAIRQIQSKFLFTRYRKEFVALTDKRVIKFEKMQYFRPKTESLFYEEIKEVNSDEPSNAVSGTFIGEKICISSWDGHQINMRMVGKGKAKELEGRIRSIHNEPWVPPANLNNRGKSKTPKSKSKKLLKWVIIAIALLTIVYFINMGMSDEKVTMVKNGFLGEYNTVTVGTVFNDMMPNGQWDEFTTDNEEVIVQYAVPDEDTIIQFIVLEDNKAFHAAYMKYLGEVLEEPSDCKIILDSLYGEYYQKHPELGQQENTSWDNVTTEGYFGGVVTVETKTVQRDTEVLDNDLSKLQTASGGEIKAFVESKGMSEIIEEMYSDEIAIISLDEQGNLISVSFNDAPYSWYGMKVGSPFPKEQVELAFEKYGYDYMGNYENQYFYAVNGTDMVTADGMFVIRVDGSQNIQEVIYSATGAAELRGDLNGVEIDNSSLVSEYDVVETLPADENYIIAYSGTSYLSEEDLLGLDKTTLRLARNEIYARHGRMFETEDLNQYFSSQPWYYGYLSADEFDESVFNGYEKANLDLIKYIEETLSPNSDENLGIANSDDYYEGDLYPINGNSMYVANCKESITLRENPSTSANEITQIPLYAAVTYIGEAANGFLEVSYNGRIGYALSSYLDVYEPQVASGVMCTVVNCNTSITLRTSPSTKAQEICQISLGESVYYIEAAANDFYLVSYNGMTGYALSSYLEFD